MGQVGSEFIVTSPDGRFVYVASSWSIAAFGRDRVTGALRLLRGAQCARGRVGGGGKRCARIKSIGRINAMVMSPDGRSIIIADDLPSDPWRLVVVRRDTATGRLSPGQCFAAKRSSKCVQAQGLLGVREIAVSPNGRNVYAAGTLDSEDGLRSVAIAVFARNPASGRLRQLTGKAGCVMQAGELRAGCSVPPPWVRRLYLHGPMTVSASGRDLFLADAKVVVSLRRDLVSGALSAPRPQSCLGSVRIRGCRRGLRVQHLDALQLAPSGRHLYVNGLYGLEALRTD
jgi:hypothetical protein